MVGMTWRAASGTSRSRFDVNNGPDPTNRALAPRSTIDVNAPSNSRSLLTGAMMSCWPKRLRGQLNIPSLDPRFKCVGPDQHRDGRGVGDELAQHLQPFGSQEPGHETHAGHVAAGPVEAADQPVHDRIAASPEYDRHRRGGGLGRERRIDIRDNDRHRQADQLGDQTRQAVQLIVGVAVFNRDVLAFVEPRRCEALTEARDHGRGRRKRRTAQKPDYRHSRLLRPRRQRPRSRRAAKQRDEFATLHSMTSSARASTVSGTVRPSALAVLRLITSSYLVA